MAQHEQTEPVYIQDKHTGIVFAVDAISDQQRKDQKWNMRFRRVRLYVHPESDSVFCEDWYISGDMRADSTGECNEIDIDEYQWLKTLYANPEL